MSAEYRIAVIIPALNEEQSIGKVIDAIPSWVERVVVTDNGSTDDTAEVARRHGAMVVHEPQRGYGAACLAGVAAIEQPNPPDLLVFLDGDYSDCPQEMDRLVRPILQEEADLVIGSRVLGNPEPGSLTIPQRFGNALACRLIHLFTGVVFTDLGPFRAIRTRSLLAMRMDDRNYGWTVQMQVRAAGMGLHIAEVPVSYRPRIGQSKISGTVRGVMSAGAKILYTIFRETLFMHRRPATVMPPIPAAAPRRSIAPDHPPAEAPARESRHHSA
jgi:glycosyltransferase involved in cell wall biosynthesis